MVDYLNHLSYYFILIINYVTVKLPAKDQGSAGWSGSCTVGASGGSEQSEPSSAAIAGLSGSFAAFAVFQLPAMPPSAGCRSPVALLSSNSV